MVSRLPCSSARARPPTGLPAQGARCKPPKGCGVKDAGALVCHSITDEDTDYKRPPF
jgi:hypothetical protein